MNRSPLWKYVLIALAVVFGALYTTPNFYGEAPAVQVASIKVTVHADTALLSRVEQVLQGAGIAHEGITLDVIGNNPTVRARLGDVNTQLRARDALEAALNPDAADPSWSVASNLVSRTPLWMQSVHALPLNLGLDLRGGVHFLMQVDLEEAVTKRVQTAESDLRTLLREKDVRHAGITRAGDSVQVRFRDEASREQARDLIRSTQAELALQATGTPADPMLVATLTPQANQAVRENALQQNITTLKNRINELEVSEPVVQQQGADRILVELPGVQDTARAKNIIGRTATLEARLVDESPEGQAAKGGAVPPPFGSERFTVGDRAPEVLKRDVIFSGQQLQRAQASFDSQTGEPIVSITLNDGAGRYMRQVTRENLKKRMAVVLFERGRGQLLSVATIQSEFGSNFQITGSFSSQSANDLALLLRAGALAAPMEIIEEQIIGPSLGAQNIAAGEHATMYGLVAVSVFMLAYYMLFGAVSVFALGLNLALLVAILSFGQATLTLPGIAAIAFTLGMAIDSNVLINERIREELRKGGSAQQSITLGYERAFATILDSNVTTLIAGVCLLAFGSGPVRSFAVVHVLGILTSAFSAVLVSRGIVNLLYGYRRRLQSISIGQIWRPDAENGKTRRPAPAAPRKGA
jgi:preprotein translocase subunit SecD